MFVVEIDFVRLRRFVKFCVPPDFGCQVWRNFVDSFFHSAWALEGTGAPMALPHGEMSLKLERKI